MVGTRPQQSGNKDRPYYVYVWQGPISGNGLFGPTGGWEKYDQGFGGRQEGFGSDDDPLPECIANCNPGSGSGDGPPPIYGSSDPSRPRNPVPPSGGREPIVEAIVPQGLPGETGAIISFFPPIEVSVDCQQSPLRIEGGQIETIYDLTISARGFLRDEVTNNIILPFNVSTVIRGPGPIVGYTVSQYTLPSGGKDLRAVVYYFVTVGETTQLADFSKNFRLSLSSLVGGDNNLTLEGNAYYFETTEVTLDNLVRADGINDSCGTSECEVEWSVNYYNTGAPGVPLNTGPLTQNVPFTVVRIAPTGPPGSVSQQVIAYSEGDVQSVPIYGASGLEVITSAPLLNINCSYDVNGQLPGCFIETPETCRVLIRDQSGILFDQVYFGRPTIETNNTYTSQT